jgi:O-antigen ligase
MKRGELIIVALFVLLAIVIAALALLSTKAALVALVGIAAIAIIFFEPFYGLIIYLLMLYIRPQDFVPVLERLRVMLVLAVAILVVFFIRRLIGRREISIFATRQHILMFALLVIVPFSDIVNGRMGEVWDGFNEFLTVFLLFFIIVNITSDYEKYRKVIWTLVFLTVLIAINGIIMYYRGVGLAGSTPVEGTRVRWIGIFGDPNDYALVINSFLPFILVTFFEGKISRAQKTLLLIGGLISIMTLYFTNSRGGFIAFMTIVGVFSVRRWGLLKGIAVGAVFLVAAAVLAPSRMGNLSPYETSAAGRVNAWIDGLVVLKAHPIFGVGFQNFGDYSHSNLAAHSAFIKCMAELGLVGYFLWMALLYTSYTDLKPVANDPRNRYSRYARILQLSIIGFVASAAFLSQTFMPVLYILVALSVLTSHNGENRHKYARFLSVPELGIVILLIGVSIVGYKLLAMVYI